MTFLYIEQLKGENPPLQSLGLLLQQTEALHYHFDIIQHHLLVCNFIKKKYCSSKLLELITTTLLSFINSPYFTLLEAAAPKIFFKSLSIKLIPTPIEKLLAFSFKTLFALK